MNLRFFIDRPVFSGVISVVIVLMGVIAMKALPVEQYPDSGTTVPTAYRGTGQAIHGFCPRWYGKRNARRLTGRRWYSFPPCICV